jgi:hypothetical protein
VPLKAACDAVYEQHFPVCASHFWLLEDKFKLNASQPLIEFCKTATRFCNNYQTAQDVLFHTTNKRLTPGLSWQKSRYLQS